VRGLPKLGFGLLLIGLIFILSFTAREARDKQRSTVYNGILEYIENNIPQDQTIGYLLSHRPYLLYGKHLDRKVAYVPAESNGQSEWLDALKKRKVSFVAIGPTRDQLKSEKAISWLEKNNGPFIRVFGRDPSKEICIYRFIEYK
jgi:hypothetical protein